MHLQYTMIYTLYIEPRNSSVFGVLDGAPLMDIICTSRCTGLI